MAVKISASLYGEQLDFAKALVASGRYSSVSAVLQQGVDLLQQRLSAEAVETEALPELLRQRRNGPFIDPATLDERLDRMIDDERRTYRLQSRR